MSATPGMPADADGADNGSTSTATGSASAATGSTVARPVTARPATARLGSTRVARSGRREHARGGHKPSLIERYRTAIVALAALVGVALVATFVFLSASAPATACTNVWVPAATSSPAANATPALGYVQPDMGRRHINVGEKVTYTYCAPASGSHANRAGAGPVQPRVYGPNDSVGPQGWIHNLEHGGMVLLYRGDSEGATDAGQAALRAFYDSFPPGPVCGAPRGAVGPVIARFDQMSTPFQAIVWDRVLPLQTLDQAQILAYWQQWGERTNPEAQCAPPSSRPAPSVVPSSSAVPSAAPSSSATPSPSKAPSKAPSAAPSPSPS